MRLLVTHPRPSVATTENAAGVEPPECYGSGWLLVRQPPYRQVYDRVRVHPRTCFACPFEAPCLAHRSVRG
jgi:hypothetical protein